ncbi:AI-2E family transporter [bacterium]|nr:AI-2E family transporter [bacterium]
MNRNLQSWGVWLIATVALGFALHQGRDILAPFALAVFIWLVMEGFARSIRKFVPALPDWLAHMASIAIVAVGVVLVISVMAQGVREFASHADLYEARINDVIAKVYGVIGMERAPTLGELLFSDASVRFIEPALEAAQGLAANLVLILIYVGFLYLASTTWSQKLDKIFPASTARDQAREVGEEVRRSMEQYLWVQTLISVIISLLTYATLLTLGLDNPMFWAFIIFFLNFIPTIGSIFAAVLPALFALVQPAWPDFMPADPAWCALIVFLAVSVWQFGIGNFVQPRLMGDSLNLSALVVLLSLAIWGALWGIPGMFLAAPMTVMIMILIAQVPGARWIAVLLSADGSPGVRSPLKEGADKNAAQDPAAQDPAA